MSITPIHGLPAVLSGICSVSYLYFGFYIISFALKDKRYRPLLYLCAFSSAWSFTYVMYFLSDDPYTREMWRRCGFAGMLAFVFSLWFIMRYTGLIKNKKILTLLSFAIWLPPLVWVYKNFSDNAVLLDFPFGFWFLYAEIQTTIYNIALFVLIIIFCLRSKTNKSRRQAYIICGSGIVILVLSWAGDYFFAFRNSQNIIPFWFILCIGILLYTIKKYRFIPISPEFISNDITENIEEGIILLDPDLKIIFTNRTVCRLLNVEDTESVKLQDFVFEKHILNNELSKLIKTAGISFRTRINFIPWGKDQKLPVDMKVKKVIDNYNDISGFLIIVSRAKDIEHLKTIYKITGRELEVIRQLTAGKTNKDISGFLSITEKTVETHVANIYSKLLIKNRIELINILAEFNSAKMSENWN
jgi:DNA-binding CsgD family transcriptional regulator